jgi:hypothetical protein
MLVDKIKNRTWEGQIYRTKDNKKLSDVKLKIAKDTMYIFSNAIFGSGNDTLTLVSDNEKDSTFIYKNIEGNQITLNYKYKQTDKAEILYLIGNDFYIVLGISSIDISAPKALDFYMNINVPRDAEMYLDGAYEGTVEFENQLLNVFSQYSELELKIKLVFLDNFKVKVYGSILWGNTAEIQSYKEKGDKIYIGNSGKLYEEGLKVTNEGLKLVYQGDDMNLILNKIY